MLRVLILVFSLLILALPVNAQDAAHVQTLLDSASAAFKQDNYFKGVGDTQQACGMIRANPSTTPGYNYMGIALNCFEGIKKKLKRPSS